MIRPPALLLCVTYIQVIKGFWCWQAVTAHFIYLFICLFEGESDRGRDREIVHPLFYFSEACSSPRPVASNSIWVSMWVTDFQTLELNQKQSNLDSGGQSDTAYSHTMYHLICGVKPADGKFPISSFSFLNKNINKEIIRTGVIVKVPL